MQVCTLTMGKTVVDVDRCIASFTPEVFATDRVMDMVKNQGMAFRDAYREVAKTLDATEMDDPVANIQNKTHVGATGNLALDAVEKRMGEVRNWSAKARETWETAIEQLTR